ncbi:ScyD/ScyE family protein [Aeromicrobium sp. P5_D10]
MKRSSQILVAATATLLVSGFVTSGPAIAGGRDPSPSQARTWADGLLTPLSLAVDAHGRALVSQNFKGELTRISSNGARTTIAASPGNELGAVSTRGRTIYWATTGQDPASPAAALWAKRKGHPAKRIADLRAFEAAKNPDQRKTYGFRDLPQSCIDQFPADNPASYTGLVDSHPYASYAAKNKVYVADAGANAILSVRTDKRHARPKVVATLPARGSVVTAEALQAQGLPTCAAGHKYYFEFVPTDVERARNGWLYVTSLPGGPEDASLGARGAVYKVNPHNGKARQVAGGFVGATDLALGPDGTIAVAELFGGATGAGQVTFIKPWSSYRKSLPLTAPGAVEWTGTRRHSKLYVTTDAFVLGAEGPQPIGKLQVLKFH